MTVCKKTNNAKTKEQIKMTDNKKITLLLNDDLLKKIQQEAERKYITKTELINIILYDYFENIVQE